VQQLFAEKGADQEQDNLPRRLLGIIERAIEYPLLAVLAGAGLAATLVWKRPSLMRIAFPKRFIVTSLNYCAAY
jgi:hypothetical protein